MRVISCLQRLASTSGRWAAFGVLGWAGAAANPAEVAPLFLDAAGIAPASTSAPSSGLAAFRSVQVNVDALRPGRQGLRQVGARLSVAVADQLNDTVVVDETRLRDLDAFTCLGHLEREPQSVVLLAVVGDAMVGTFMRPGKPALQVQPMGGGGHRLGPAASPTGDWCATGVLAPATRGDFEAAKPGSGRDSSAPSPMGVSPSPAGPPAVEPPLLDFLVLYTQRALEGAGGEAGIHALMDYAVAENNFCYENSGVQARWNIVGRERIAYTESGNLATDLLWLADNATVAALKAAYQADLVLLMVEHDRLGYAGIAISVRQGHGYSAFLRPWVASGLFVVPHEVGHLLGAGHDRFTCDHRASRAGCGSLYAAFSYGHRFEVAGLPYRTVMAYEPGIGIPYFSSPAVRFQTVPTGVAEGATNAADNVRTMNLRAPVVARNLDPSCRFEFTTSSLEAVESAGVVHLTVRRTGNLARSASVECATVAATATPGEDFQPYVGRLAFAAGVAELSVPIRLLHDPGVATAGEGDEQFLAILRNPEAGTALGLVSQMSVILLDAEMWIQPAQPHASVSEFAREVQVPVRRGGDATQPATVSYLIRPGTAQPGLDYEATSGVVTLAPGQRESSIRVLLLSDTLAEPDESFEVELGPAGAPWIVIGARTTTITILDDDREGGVDPAFVAETEVRPPTSTGGLLALPDGRLLVAGAPDWRQSPALVLRRLLPDGAADPSFREVEFLPAPGADPGAISPVTLSLTRQSDGRVLVAGEFALVHGQSRSGLVRLHPDGAPDDSFAAVPDSACYHTSVQPDGRIIVAGSFHYLNGVERRCLARLFPDGSLDPSFRPQADRDTIRVRATALQSDGQVLVCGTFWGFETQSRPYFARLSPDGALDRAFAARVDGLVNAVAVLPDQRIVIAGGFTSPRPGVARLLPNGSTDPSFDAGAVFNAPLRQLAPLEDGRLLVAGGFSGAGPAMQNYLLRLSSKGVPDLSFDSGVGPDDIVSSVALQPDGGVLIHGFFQQVNGVDRPYLARLRGIDLRLRFGPCTLLADGGVRLRLEGFAGGAYVVEESADLSAWRLLREGMLVAPSLEWVEAPLAGGRSVRYFRARSAR